MSNNQRSSWQNGTCFKRCSETRSSLDDLVYNPMLFDDIKNGKMSLHSTLPSSRPTKPDMICVICGAQARGYNFGVITCMSCKIFFHRNALNDIDKLKCHREGACRMTPFTRRYCTHCRLRTCFQSGMRKNLIRRHKESMAPDCHTNPQGQTTNSAFIRPLDLLQWSDRSHLPDADWSLLRQISSIFDRLSSRIVAKADILHRELLSIGVQPPKMRAKAPQIFEMVNIFGDAALTFLKHIPHFDTLPLINKQALLGRNTRPVFMFHAFYEMNLKPVQALTETPCWTASIETVLSPTNRDWHYEIHGHIGRVLFLDPCLIKFILIILAFSANNIDHGETTLTSQLNEYAHAYLLHQIQNVYVNLMWKYMTYRIGEQNTVRLFSDIMRVILRAQIYVSMMDNTKASFERKFDQALTKLTDQTVRCNLNGDQ